LDKESKNESEEKGEKKRLIVRNQSSTKITRNYKNTLTILIFFNRIKKHF